MPSLTWDDNYEPDRGKVYSADDLSQMDSFARYLDVDGDGICYRTLPGEHPKGAYLIRGSGHNKFGGYTEKADEYQEVVDRLRRKFDTATGLVPEPVIESGERADCAIVSSGSCDGAVREARDKLAAEGIHADYMRIRAFPFSPSVAKFLSRYERVFVVEQNRDAQLRSLLQTETGVAGDKLISSNPCLRRSPKGKQREFHQETETDQGSAEEHAGVDHYGLRRGYVDALCRLWP